MIDVVNNSTPYLSDDDVNAMATYLKPLSATSTEYPSSRSTPPSDARTPAS
mgnify:CR=1 FL=1